MIIMHVLHLISLSLTHARALTHTHFFTFHIITVIASLIMTILMTLLINIKL
jgi:hypothetical protein